MSNMWKWWTFFVCLIVFAGCEKKKERVQTIAFETNNETRIPESQNISINIRNAENWSNLITESELIVLDDSVGDIMGPPLNMVVRGDTIFGMDAYRNPGLYAYLRSGKQIMAYTHQGSGPGDLISPSCLKVSDAEISVYDTANKQIIIIDKEGNYLRSISIPNMALNAMTGYNEDYWVDFSNIPNDEWELTWKKNEDAPWKGVLEVPDYAKGITIIEIQSLQTLANGDIIYKPVLQPRVYTLRDGNAKLRYELDFNGLWPEESEIKKEYTGNDWAKKIRNFPVQSVFVLESDNFLLVYFIHDGQKYMHIYDKNISEGKTYILDRETYLSPKYITNTELFLYRNDDTIEVVKL